MDELLKQKINKYNLKIFAAGGKKFRTVKNNGAVEGMTNQCFWISIKQYLERVKDINLTVKKLKNIASGGNAFIINGDHDQFDTSDHYVSLMNIVNNFNLSIHFYSYNAITKEISDDPTMVINGRHSESIVHIVHLGAHFELITSIGNMNLYGGLFGDSVSMYKPDIDLSIGKKIKDKSKIDADIFETYLNYNDVLSRDILNKKQDLERINKLITTLDTDYIKSIIQESSQESSQTIMKIFYQSYEESKNKYSKERKTIQDQINELIKEHKHILEIILKF